MSLRRIFTDYSSEIVFGIVLLICVGLSIWLGTFIPIDFYSNALTHIMNGSIAAICLFGAWLMSRHTDGMKVRKIWVFVLLFYALFSILLLADVTSFVDAPKQGLVCLQGWEILAGNFLLWSLLLYLTETLRPGWLTVSKALLRGLPAIVAFIVNEITTIDLRALLAIYPIILFGFLVTHISKYRKWCEENFSSMDHIDTQWIIRYIIMYLIDGALFFTLCFYASVSVAFTQQWLLLLMLCYSTEQILYRDDPWSNIRTHRPVHPVSLADEPAEEEEQETPDSSEFNAEYRAKLEQWMESDKPYLNPEFRLLDLREILPLNRTYLSQLINAEYGCNFYQFVTNYRIEEAKRLMREHPDLKLQDVAEQSGFSSPIVFSRIFARETGVSPREWNGEN